MTKKRGLGKGLSALLENSDTDITSRLASGEDQTRHVAGSVAGLRISQIVANPFQPRKHFEKEPLEELAASIREHGIIQPVTVRKMGYDKYQLISGERRFRASQLAGLDEIPAYIRIANDQTMLEMALIENIQRENLDAVEVAISYQRLIDECKLTQEQLSERVGKKRSTITNYLRLLKLAPEVQMSIQNKEISMGHARALVSAGDDAAQVNLLAKILAEGLSVRQVEEIVRGAAPEKPSRQPAAPKTAEGTERVPLSFQQQKYCTDLSESLGTKIEMSKGNKGKGRLVINFSSENDLERIMDILDL
jgi:ParB family chromosome partitioning protein